MAPIISRSTPISGVEPTQKRLSTSSQKLSLSSGDASTSFLPVTTPCPGSTELHARPLRTNVDPIADYEPFVNALPNKTPYWQWIRESSPCRTLKYRTCSTRWTACAKTTVSCSGLPFGRTCPTPKLPRSSNVQHTPSTNALYGQEDAWSTSSNEFSASVAGRHGWIQALRKGRHEYHR